MAWNDNTNAILAMDNFYGPNPYSNFSGQPLPWPSSYAGMPTDARSNPIQPPPGVTLNQTPAAAPQAAPAAPAMVPKYGDWSSLVSNGSPQGQAYANNLGLGPVGPYVPPSQSAAPSVRAAAAQAAPPAPPQQAPGTMDLNSALTMLANPGHVTTPGAQPTAPPQGPSVLQNFLANNQGGTGAGNYSNKGFFQTLNALKGATQPGGAT